MNLNKVVSFFKSDRFVTRPGTEQRWEMSVSDWVAVGGAALGAFMAILDTQITNASLREIQGSLGLDFSESGWISTSYLIAEVIVIPLTAFLSRVFGMRRYILANCLIFIISSLSCGLAWDLKSMIFFRIFQGLSGGTLIPMAFQIMLTYMPPHRKAVGLTIFGLTATLAPTLGPSLGGWLTQNYSWRASFFINLVPGLFMLASISYGISKAKTNIDLLKKIDYFGILFLVLGLGTLTYFLEEGAKNNWFDDLSIQICFLTSLVSLPIFVALQLKGKEPLLNLRLLRDRNFGSAAVVTMITAIALYGGIYSLSLYLGQIQNYGAMDIGKVMMWVGIPQLFVMPFLPWLMKRVDSRILAVIGMSLFAISNFMNSGLSPDYAGDQFIVSLIIRALGQPLFIIPLSSMGMAMVSPLEAGNASSIYNVMRNLGGSIGIALAGTFLVSHHSSHFADNSQKLSSFDSSTIEKVVVMKKIFTDSGIDGETANALVVKDLLSEVEKTSYTQSFSDIFLVLALILIGSVALIAFMKKPKIINTSFDTSGH